MLVFKIDLDNYFYTNGKREYFWCVVDEDDSHNIVKEYGYGWKPSPNEALLEGQKCINQIICDSSNNIKIYKG